MESAGTNIYCVKTFLNKIGSTMIVENQNSLGQLWLQHTSMETLKKKTQKACEKSSYCLKNFFVDFRFEQFMRN